MSNLWLRSLAVLSVVGSVAGCTAGAKKIEASGSGVKASGVALAAGTAAEAVPPQAIVTPATIKWLSFPLGGRGAKAAIIAGDPEKAGPFVLRIKSPAGAKMAPHSSPGDAHFTVLSGTFAIGMGDAFDAKKLTVMPAGSYTLMPREMRHFALSKTATVVQVHGMGPFQMNFVNPADDPRKKTAAR